MEHLQTIIFITRAGIVSIGVFEYESIFVNCRTNNHLFFDGRGFDLPPLWSNHSTNHGLATNFVLEK